MRPGLKFDPRPADNQSVRQPVELDRISEPRHLVVASRLADDYLEHRRWTNNLTWQNPRNWVRGFYFGEGDTRLWVPKRQVDGHQHPTDRVINFRHALGRKAFGVLMLGYGIAVVSILLLVAIAFGQRW